MSQQHLIWQSTELEDDRTLREYHIHNGATLQLVLGMRGGPVNTRRGTSSNLCYYIYNKNLDIFPQFLLSLPSECSEW